MKILHVAESAKGGVGSYLSELLPLQCATLGARNIRVIVPDAHAFQIGPLPNGSLVTFNRPDRSSAGLTNLAKALRCEVDRFAPDIIHIHSTFAGVVVRAIYGWRRDRPKIVYCPHGWAFDRKVAAWKRATAMAIELGLAAFCDQIIAVSDYEARAARSIGIPGSKIRTVLNGLSAVGGPVPSNPAPWADDRLKVLFIGRLDHQKGFDTLLDAITPLRSRVSVRVAGEAVADTVSMASADTVTERLGWLAPAEIKNHLAAADVVVMPSRWEAFGLVALEAMRAGRMVIASNVGGLPEVVRHGETGWLVPPDSPVALGRSILDAQRADRQQMGARGRSRFLSLFTAERMHRDLVNIYERFIPAEGIRLLPVHA